MCLTVVLDCAVYRGYCFIILCGFCFMIDTVLETLYMYHGFVVYGWTGPVLHM